MDYLRESDWSILDLTVDPTSEPTTQPSNIDHESQHHGLTSSQIFGISIAAFLGACCMARCVYTPTCTPIYEGYEGLDH